MEIIKTGLEMSEAECHCGTVLRYWPSEIKTEVEDRYVSRYPIRVPLYNYIVCPLCGRRILIKRYEYEEIKSENQKGFLQRMKQWLTKR